MEKNAHIVLNFMCKTHKNCYNVAFIYLHCIKTQNVPCEIIGINILTVSNFNIIVWTTTRYDIFMHFYCIFSFSLMLQIIIVYLHRRINKGVRYIELVHICVFYAFFSYSLNNKRTHIFQIVYFHVSLFNRLRS